MLIEEIKKLEKLKEKENINSTDIKKIKSIEKKYSSLTDVGNGIKIVYIDKYKRKVAVFETGEIFQFDGPKIHPLFLSYMLAYAILFLISIPIMIYSLSHPEWEFIAKGADFTIILAGLTLNILTIVHYKTTMIKNKPLLLFLIVMIIFNLLNIFN